jgi:hypothetical protein
MNQPRIVPSPFHKYVEGWGEDGEEVPFSLAGFMGSEIGSEYLHHIDDSPFPRHNAFRKKNCVSDLFPRLCQRIG